MWIRIRFRNTGCIYEYFLQLGMANVCAYRYYHEMNSTAGIPEKELRGLSPSVHIHVSVSDLYIPTIGLPILLQGNMWTDPGNI
jgi:hypothetical protein